ncbi:MAG: EAL domain-containing protein [Lachnospiraceae bacterium]|nr:EAL domain-containing protein [Lachnospiraceae bacterium]
MTDEKGNVVNCAYVIDKDFHITHYNSEIKRIYPDLEIGDFCYKRLQEADSPCKVCPVTTLKKEGLLFYNKCKGLWLDCMAAPLDLVTGKEDHVVICHTVTELREDQKEEALRLLEGEGPERNTLTGLYNREVFFTKVETMLRASRPSEYCMIALDVDNLKLYNTLYGFEQGNDFLHYIGYSMKEVLGGIGFAGYLGEDDFVAFLPNRQELLIDILERIKYYIDSRKQNTGFYPAIGVFVIDDTKVSMKRAYDKASLARTLLRGNHLSRMIWYDESMIREMEENYSILGDMKRGLKEDEFIFYLQPKCSMVDHRIIGMEALCRWQHPEKGLLGPGSFVPRMEANSLVTELDCHVWEKVCQMLKRWQDAGIGMVPISVNVSRIDMYELNIIKVFEELVEKYGIQRKYLEIEVTKSAYAENEWVVKHIVNQLKERGFTVSMDDFGSGYSSLNMLQNVSVDVLKLDMRFLRMESDSEERGIHILEMIIHLAQSLNIQLIAEGVETEKQRDILLHLGCEYAQGYLYFKPMSVEAAERLLETAVTGDTGNENTVKEEVKQEQMLDPQALLAQIYSLTERLQTEEKKMMIYESAMNGYFDEEIEVDFKNINREKAMKNAMALLEKRWKLSFLEKDRIWKALNPSDLLQMETGLSRRGIMFTEDGRELVILVVNMGSQKAMICVKDQGMATFDKIIMKHPLLWFYDYNTETNTLQIHSRSGEESETATVEEFFSRVRSQKLLSEERFHKLKKTIIKAMQMPTFGDIEYEAINEDGSKVWKRLFYLSLANQKGKVYRIVGIAGDIQKGHMREETLKDKANRDQMTGFFNHYAALNYMEEALEAAGGGTLLSLDIDDFKQINDKVGHMRGDDCIRKLAELLRETFRKGDILGRMGSDGFLIFMPGVVCPETAKQKVQELFLKMKKIWIPRVGEMTCSVGISNSEEAGLVLKNLRKQSDYALYEAKNSGKGHFVSIENGQAVHDDMQSLDESLVVDKEAMRNKREFIGELFMLLYQAETKEKGIHHALAFIGETMDVSRVYVFSVDTNVGYAKNIYEWCAKGIEPQIDQLQMLSLEDIGYDFDVLYENDMWFLPDVSMIQQAGTRRLLEKQDIKGMLHWVFRRKGKIVGLIGFDECRDNVNWTSQYAEVLRHAGEVLSRYILSDD